MATISAVILKHHKKLDGTWNVKFRITHQGSSVYIDSPLTAAKSDLDTKLRLKKVFIDRYLVNDLNRFRVDINNLGVRLNGFSATDIKEYLLRNDSEVDYIEFYRKSVERLYLEKRELTAIKRASSLRRLIEFNKSDKLNVLSINKRYIDELISFLKIGVRKDSIERGGRSNQTIRNTIADIKAVFNEIKRKFNDEDRGIIKIPGNPFGGVKDILVKETRKRNLSVDTMIKIRDMELEGEGDIISRDIFMLSFYLCGINAIDIYDNLRDENIDRMEYNRRKTARKRSDSSFISVKVPIEAKELIQKYSGFLQKRYASCKSLSNRLSMSLTVIGDGLGIDRLTFYHARHTFATLARNECRFSKDDVAAALNHSSSTVTDIYIAKDWSIIDEVQEGVLNLLR